MICEFLLCGFFALSSGSSPPPQEGTEILGPNEGPTIRSASSEEIRRIIREMNDSVPADILEDSTEVKRQAMGASLLWNTDRIKDRLNLTKKEDDIVSKILEERKLAQIQNERSYRASLVLTKETSGIDEDKLKKNLAEFVGLEKKAEDKFLADLEEILTPDQNESLVSFLVKKDRYALGTLTYLDRSFKLNAKQRQIFRKTEKLTRTFYFSKDKAAEEGLKRETVLASMKSAVNCLDREQFARFYGMFTDLDGDTLEEHFKKQDRSDKERLSGYYRWFKQVREELKDAS